MPPSHTQALTKGQILPWDSDIDVQVSEATIAYLAKYYNMTEYHFSVPEIETGRNYLLEINPHYTIRGIEDKLKAFTASRIKTKPAPSSNTSPIEKTIPQLLKAIPGP